MSCQNKYDKIKVNLVFGASITLFICSFCTYYNFLVLYLKSENYSDTTIGLCMMLISMVSVIAPPFWGYMADNVIPIKRVILLCLTLAAPLSFLLPLTVSIVPLALLSTVIISFVEKNLGTIFDSYGMRMQSKKPYFNYGIGRGSASFIFAFFSMFLGKMFSKFGIDKMFYFHVVTLALCFLFSCFLDNLPKKESQGKGTSFFEAIAILRKNKQYVVTVTSMALSTFAFVSVGTFQPILIRELNGNEYHLGLAMFTMAICESPVIFFYSKISKYVRTDALLLISLVFIFLRPVLVVISPNLGFLIAVQSVQALGFGLYLPSILIHISKITEDHIKSTAITLAFACCECVAGIFGNFFGGIISENLGVKYVFIIFSIFPLISVFLFGSHLIKRIRY